MSLPRVLQTPARRRDHRELRELRERLEQILAGPAKVDRDRRVRIIYRALCS